jgi:hypothetical protein
MHRIKAKIDETRPHTSDRIGFSQPGQRRDRSSHMFVEMIVACRYTIGVLVLAIGAATGCSSDRGGSAISGPSSGPTSTPVDAHSQPIMVPNVHALGAPIFHADDERRKGVIHLDLLSAAAVFRPVDYDIVILHVQSASVPNLVLRVKSQLAASRRVVLDSDGDEQGRILVSAIARAVTGGGSEAEGALIFMVQEGVYAVTPLETVAMHRRRQTSAGKQLSAGNTARYALGID